ncbi:MAG: hypothetical protein CTY34_08750 [Methylobacter sp.]|nr:MAG: hypothetical protein CTY34_08750 [Methylobacter sp.]PPD18696.1 MAG: hypothetical protein CTY24_12520 [Methylobacter sp.]PPD32298.1 MAG: hypothetical protein CTY18_10800 [Methylomonas sp.]
MDNFWIVIDQSSQILGILSFIPIIYSAWILGHIKRKRKKLLDNIRKTPGDKPGVLIIDSIRAGGESIHSQVENWLWQQPQFKDKQTTTEIEILEFKELTPNDMIDINRRLRQSVGKLQSKGVTQYLIFIRGPLALAIVVGCVLANHRPSVIYQQSKHGGYESWGAIND